MAASTTSIAATSQSPTSAISQSPTLCAGCVGPQSLGYNFDTGIAAGPIAAPLKR